MNDTSLYAQCTAGIDMHALPEPIRDGVRRQLRGAVRELATTTDNVLELTPRAIRERAARLARGEAERAQYTADNPPVARSGTIPAGILSANLDRAERLTKIASLLGTPLLPEIEVCPECEAPLISTQERPIEPEGKMGGGELFR